MIFSLEETSQIDIMSLHRIIDKERILLDAPEIALGSIVVCYKHRSSVITEDAVFEIRED